MTRYVYERNGNIMKRLCNPLYNEKGQIVLIKKSNGGKPQKKSDKKKRKPGKWRALYDSPDKVTRNIVLVPESSFIGSINEVRRYHENGDNWLNELSDFIYDEVVSDYTFSGLQNMDIKELINPHNYANLTDDMDEGDGSERPLFDTIKTLVQSDAILTGLEPTAIKQLLASFGMMVSMCEQGMFSDIEILSESLFGDLIDIVELLVASLKGISSSETYKRKFEIAILSAIAMISKSFYEYSATTFIPDIEYDKVIETLNRLSIEPTTPSILSGRRKVYDDSRLAELAINMKKCYTIYATEDIPDGVSTKDSIESWLTSCVSAVSMRTFDEIISVTADRKFDGVAVRGHLRDGVLYNALTRGESNGLSTLIAALDGYVLDDTLKGEFGCQFEAVVSEDIFLGKNEEANRIMNTYGMRNYATKRSMASAIINRMADPDATDLQKLITLIPVDSIGYMENETLAFRLNRLRSKFETQLIYGFTGNITQILYSLEHVILEKFLVERNPLGFPTDGVVLTIDTPDIKEAVGRNGRTNNWQIAYKFSPETTTGIVDHVELTSGRRGGKGILISLETPAILNDQRYPRVIVNSVGIFDKLGLCTGDKVRISYISDVMPEIIGVVSRNPKGEPLKIPDVCNSCGSPLIEVSKRPFCQNPKCPDNVYGRIRSFVDDMVDGFPSSIIMNKLEKIEHIDFETKKHMTDYGVMDFILDVVSNGLDVSGEHAKRMLDLLRSTIVTEFPKKENYEILALIKIPGIGVNRARELMARYGSVRNLISVIESLDLATASDEIKNKNILKALISASNYLPEIKESLRFIDNDNYAANTDSLTVGHSQCDIRKMKPITKICERMGFQITDGRKFDILIVGSKKTSTGKVGRAKKKKLPVYTVEEFINHYSAIQ